MVHQQKENVSSSVSVTRRRLTVVDVMRIIDEIPMQDIRKLAKYVHKNSLKRYFIKQKFPNITHRHTAELTGASSHSTCATSIKVLNNKKYLDIREYIEKKIEFFLIS